MKASDIHVGDRYLAKVNGRLVTVRVDDIQERWNPLPRPDGRYSNIYRVTNLLTGRRLVFRSPQKFRGEAARQ